MAETQALPPVPDRSDPPAPDGTERDGAACPGGPAVYALRAALVRAPRLSPPDPEKMGGDPEMFRDNPPFLFRAEISNDREDAYYTRMHPSSLKNYAAEAEGGVALQNSHRHYELPMGQTYRGRYLTAGSQPDQTARTHADMYTLPGLKLGEVSTDDLIRGIQGGVIRDVSIGFYGGTYRCTLCGRDMWDRDCEHVPGLSYGSKGANGEADGEEQRAAAWVHDAHLAEVSTVYDGATPGAGILKAQRMADAGRLNPGQARWLETRYRLRLYGSQRYFALPEGSRMNESLPETLAPAQPDLRALLAESGVDAGDDPLAVIRQWLRDGYTPPQPERQTPEPAPAPPAAPPAPPEPERAPPESRPAGLAAMELADARYLREQVVEAARRELVRALGNEVDVAFHLARWQELPLSAITAERDHYALIAARLFPGGRLSLDTAPRETPPAAPIPDAAYAS